MTEPRLPDPDRKWRAVWTAVHSPFILLPAVLVGTIAAADDVMTAVPRHGRLLGALIAVLLLTAIAVTLIDLMPHLIRWLRVGHALLTAALGSFGRAIDKLADRIAGIVKDG